MTESEQCGRKVLEWLSLEARGALMRGAGRRGWGTVASVGGVGRGERVLRQLLVAAALAAFVVACLRLGWWQWQRYHGPGGSLQNLGYTLQWPTFAVFALFMAWRLRQLERRHRAQAPQPAEAPEQPEQPGQPEPCLPAPRDRATPPTAVSGRAVRRPDGGPEDEPDDELAAYNRYLAQLNAKEQHRGR
jgi:hypothetical protein